MGEFIKGKATICIVNYKTIDFTRLCLRSIRKFTTYPHKVIVVDNNSQDQSLEYLKGLNWIRLLQRDTKDDQGGGHSHAAGLELALSHCDTEFFISMHSDTFVQKSGWLSDLISHFNNDERIACVGSGKIELTPRWQVLLKKATDLRTFKRKLLREPDHIGKHRYYNRTICCLYRTDVLKREQLSFLMDREKGLTAGKKLYFELIDRGYKTIELPLSVIGRYVVHLAHATEVANLGEFTSPRKTVRKCHKILKQIMSKPTTLELIKDDSLDIA